jgi:adenylosuccinate synthase
MTGLSDDYIAIDPQAVVIDDEDVQTEAASGIRQAIGSTATGIGEALLRRVSRLKQPTFAFEVPELSHLVRNTKSLLRERLSQNQRVILEGTQGYGLSLLHSPYYPHVTARDTTAAGFLSEAGLSPLDVDDIVMVLRAFPIRVPGASGPLPGEIDWDVVTTESNSHEPVIEYTSVTNTVRRVARFDPTIVKLAIQTNAPTRLVLNHVDYVDSVCRNSDHLSDKAIRLVHRIEEEIKQRIDFVGTGPGTTVSARSLRTSA